MFAMDTLLARLSESVSSARTVEELTRPLLALLEATTGMESTYLTTVDLDRGLQHVLFARNTQALQIPEGIDWIIDGGDGISIFESSAGDFCFMTGGWRIRRWHSGDANATVPAFCQSVDGVVVDDVNGSVTFQTSDNPTTIAAAVWARMLDSGFDASRMLRIVAAAVAGKTTGGPDGFIARDLADSQDQITGTADPATGNRTGATYGS